MKRLTILLLVLLSFSLGNKLVSQPTVGQKAPALSGIKLIDRQLPNPDSKFVFIDFWATWCSPCRKTLPHVDKLAEKYTEKVVFLAISDEKETEVRQFLQKNKFSSLVFGLDIHKNLFSTLEIQSIPQYILISPDNTIIASGFSSDISDAYLDSVITHYTTTKPTFASSIEISEDSMEKVSSIEISERKGMTRYISQSGYTFIVRDSLHIVLPYLTGVKLANRMELQNIPRKMVEVKIFSRNTPFDSLKNVAYNLMMASYGITKSSIIKTTTVFDFQVTNHKLLRDKNTFTEPGALKYRNIINDSTYMFDNYTFQELVTFLESAYFPLLFYVKNSSSEEYDWGLKIVDPVKKEWVSFEKLTAILKNEFGIEIRERKNKEMITVFN